MLLKKDDTVTSMKKISSLFIMLLMMLSVFTVTISPVHAALDGLHEGDTISYTVTKADIPLSKLFPNDSYGVDWSKAQFDLTGSTIGVKVMKTFPSTGNYILNSFFVLGKSIAIPLPNATANASQDILGSEFTLPAGVGYSLGDALPGSNFVSYINNGTFSGIPLYIEPSNTANYKNYLDTKASTLTNATLTTTDSSNTFQVVAYYQDTNNSLTFTLKWYKTGSNAGLFQSFNMAGTIKNNFSQSVNIAFAFQFLSRVNNPLPQEIVKGNIQTLSFDKIGLDLAWSGPFFNQLMIDNNFNTTAYNQLRSQLQSYQGQDFIQYYINDVQGMYYQTYFSIKDLNKNTYSPLVETWYNGFTGDPTTYDPTCAQTSGCSTGSNMAVFIPLLAPAITPDWPIWSANMNTVNTLIHELTTNLLSSTVATNLSTYGIKIDQLTTQIGVNNESGLKDFGIQLNLKGSYNASEANPANLPANFTGSERASLDSSIKIWEDYSQTGLLAGYGASANATISVTNMPINSTFRGDGTFTVGAIVGFKNNYVYSNLPTSTSSKVPGISPGFETLPVLIAFIAIPIISKRKKKMN